MKFSVERDVLADAVAWAARSLQIRPSAPVLAGLIDWKPIEESFAAHFPSTRGRPALPPRLSAPAAC